MDVRSWLPRLKVRTILTGLVAAGILHIVTTMLVPRLTLQTGYDRLAKGLPENRFEVLPEVTPQSQTVPFLGPDARYAVCRFNTKNAPVLVEADLPGPGWVLSIYTPQGDSLLTTPGTPQRGKRVILRLVRGLKHVADKSPLLQRTVPSEDPALALAANRGMVVLRAPDQGLSYRAANPAVLKAAKCTALFGADN